MNDDVLDGRGCKFDPGEYILCIESPHITCGVAADIATAYRGIASWRLPRRTQALACAAWWQSVSDRLALEENNL